MVPWSSGSGTVYCNQKMFIAGHVRLALMGDSVTGVLYLGCCFFIVMLFHCKAALGRGRDNMGGLV